MSSPAAFPDPLIFRHVGALLGGSAISPLA